MIGARLSARLVTTEQRGTAMQTIAFVAPILPGKTQTDREAIESCARGDRQAEYQASRASAPASSASRSGSRAHLAVTLPSS
jgi:hypothetical protein